MKLIIWLWNPWTKYERTRHNAWFLFLDFFRYKKNFEIFKEQKKFFWEISVSSIEWEKIILLKPMTFMNNSWNSVLSIKNFFKIDIKNIIIIYDDKDICFWNIRFREEWSSWWHNWIKDIIDALNTQKIARIKIWVAYKNSKIQDTANFVLSKFTNDEIKDLENIFNKAEIMLEKWIKK